MTLKLNISENGKTYKIEIESNSLEGKSLDDKIDGKIIKPELEGYELQITGGSDFAGFPMSKDVEGIGLKRILLTKGWGMHNNRKGIRLKKTVRGRTIAETSVQINLMVLKQGKNSLDKIFPDQNNPKKIPAEEKKEELPQEAVKTKEPEKQTEQPKEKTLKE